MCEKGMFFVDKKYFAVYIPNFFPNDNRIFCKYQQQPTVFYLRVPELGLGRWPSCPETAGARGADGGPSGLHHDKMASNTFKLKNEITKLYDKFVILLQ